MAPATQDLVRPGGIVVGVDGSAGSRTALTWGLREAVSRDLPLSAVLVWEPSWRDGLSATDTGALAGLVAERRRAATDLLDAGLVAAGARLGIDVDAIAVEVQGAPVPTLLSLGEEAAMLVLGRRGLGRLGRTVLGSVSSAVVQHATGPVTIVRGEPHDEPGEPGERALPRVVVGVDGSSTAVTALRHGAEAARRTGSVLVAVYCWQIVTLAPLPDSWGWAPPIDDYERFAADALDAAIEKAEIDLPPERLRRSVVHAPPSRGLLAAAEGAERLVVGNRGLGGFDRLLLGSVSRQAVDHAPCPVTVVR
ncbi:universal stress protein [Oerskovia flava]|uniref:universal stress protein n=1 Tax=Oerskovia flava TaxID=2986422 RepID=UPI00223EC40A|nr:universal stress protein [Oerskovia sp. JB1-3-2]